MIKKFLAICSECEKPIYNGGIFGPNKSHHWGCYIENGKKIFKHLTKKIK